MRVLGSLSLLALLIMPTIATADSPSSQTRVIAIDQAAFPVRALRMAAAMDAPHLLACRAAVGDDRYHAVSAMIVDGNEIAVTFFSPAGTLILRGQMATVSQASLGIDLWPRVSGAVDAVTKVLGDYSRRLEVPLPSTIGPDGGSLMSELRQLIADGQELGWRFREVLVDLPYDLAREVLKSQVPQEFAAAVDAVVDGVQLFQTGSRSREIFDSRPALRQPVYEQIVSGLKAGQDVLALQMKVLRMLSLR